MWEKIPCEEEFTLRSDPWAGLIASCGSFIPMVLRVSWLPQRTSIETRSHNPFINSLEYSHRPSGPLINEWEYSMEINQGLWKELCLRPKGRVMSLLKKDITGNYCQYWISLKIAKDSKVMTDPIDDRKFQELYFVLLTKSHLQSRIISNLQGL